MSEKQGRVEEVNRNKNDPENFIDDDDGSPLDNSDQEGAEQEWENLKDAPSTSEDERQGEEPTKEGYEGWSRLILFVLITLPFSIVISLFAMGTDTDTGPSETMAPSSSPMALEPERGNLTVLDRMLSMPDEFASMLLVTEIQEVFELMRDTESSLTVYCFYTEDVSEGSLDQLWPYYKDEELWLLHSLAFVYTSFLDYELAAIQFENGMTSTSISGDQLTLQNGRVNGQRLKQLNNYVGINGIFHRLEGFISPSWLDVTMETSLKNNFPKFYSMIETVEQIGLILVEVIQKNSPKTVFALTDEAVDKIDPEYLQDTSKLQQLLKYHIVPNGVFGYSDWTPTRTYDDWAISFGAGEWSLPTAVGSDRITAVRDGNQFTANGIQLKQADVFVNNGIIHSLDEPLIIDENRLR